MVAPVAASQGKRFHVVVVASEASPLKTSGGLGHATWGLARALAVAGHKVSMVLPFHNETTARLLRTGLNPSRSVTLTALDDMKLPFGPNGKTALVTKTVIPTSSAAEALIDFYLVDDITFTMFANRRLYGYGDDAERFLFFTMVAAKLLGTPAFAGEENLVVQTNDWQTGFLGYFLRHLGMDKRHHTPLIHVCHNAGYETPVNPHQFYLLTGDQKDWAYDDMVGLKFYGWMSPQKAAFIFSDLTVAVSPTYAEELRSGRTPPPGDRFAGVFQNPRIGDRLVGTLNGIPAELGPQMPSLAGCFTPEDLSGRLENRRAICAAAGVDYDPNKMLIACSGRWAEQKGTKVILDGLREMLILHPEIQFITVGSEASSSEGYRAAFAELVKEFPGRVGVLDFEFHTGLNLPAESVEALLMAGADLYVMTSIYEPCGLGDLYALRLGSLVLANRTGGLADAIQDGENGFLIDGVTAENFITGIERAFNLFISDRAAWHKMVATAMRRDHSWNAVAPNYVGFYQRVVDFWASHGRAA